MIIISKDGNDHKKQGRAKGPARKIDLHFSESGISAFPVPDKVTTGSKISS
jgi:hypothetical protein